MQHHRDHGGLQAPRALDRQIDGPRRFRLDPVAEPAQRAVGGESVDPSQKARILAEGISEAMNCTAFGLLAAIVALMGFAFLNGKTQGMEDDINEASVRVLNLVVANRQKVNLQGLEGQA